MKFVTRNEEAEKRLVELRQDGDDVDIFLDGRLVAFFNSKENCLSVCKDCGISIKYGPHNIEIS